MSGKHSSQIYRYSLHVHIKNIYIYILSHLLYVCIMYYNVSHACVCVYIYIYRHCNLHCIAYTVPSTNFSTLGKYGDLLLKTNSQKYSALVGIR